MATTRLKPAASISKSASSRPGRGGRDARPSRPPVYNRLWHMDADGRRYHGARRWETSAIETFVELASGVDFLYPPDWSDRDQIVFRTARSDIPFAVLRTDKPTLLRLILHIRNPQEAATIQRKLGVFTRATRSPEGRNQAELTIRTPHRLGSFAFREFFDEYVEKFRRLCGLPPGPSKRDRLLPL